MASIPYSAYAVISDRSGAAQRTHADFDAACAFLAADDAHPGAVLTRHPGDVYWLSGRSALEPPPSEKDIVWAINRYLVTYLFIDEERYANAPPSPLHAAPKTSPPLV